MANLERTILVTGATGKQGRALIRALRPSSPSSTTNNNTDNTDNIDTNNPTTTTTPTSDFRILALTRNPSSPTAQHLKSTEPHVQLVKGDLDDPDSVRKVFEDAGGKHSVWGVFMVLAFPGLGASAEGEEKQGKALADFALEYEVVHFVFSSVERGGEEDEEKLVVDRAAKARIEKHVLGLGEKGLNWTILRPAFFMENLEGFIGKLTVSVLRAGLKPDTKIDLVATKDIGRMAAETFKRPESSTHKIFTVTSDVLSISEMDAAHVRATGGKHLPSVPTFIGKFLLARNKVTQNLIADFERVHAKHSQDPAGRESYLAESRAFLPEMTSFESWVKEQIAAKAQAKTKKGGEGSENWNKVSLWKLVTGRH
ncbi:NAD(P)-binding protein [Panus rudis PR-1116 ss-1]|nr:NAD(P)-binding protein [Panus rudis PR-1116 ss-1]